MKLLLAFIFLVAMIVVMRWQGVDLVTPVSPKGIIDLEFARTADRLTQLRLFMNGEAVRLNLYLDFLFILAYLLFFVTACRFVADSIGAKGAQVFLSLSVMAALFDVAENFLLLMVWQNRFSPGLLHVVYFAAAIKFILAAAVTLYLLRYLPPALIRKRR